MVKGMVGHTDSVTGISLVHESPYLVSVSHDGSLRTWDLRTYNCVHEIPVFYIFLLIINS